MFLQKNKAAAAKLRDARGPAPCGERNWNTKMGTREIAECFALKKSGLTQKEIMARLKVGRTAVQRALAGQTSLSREFLKPIVKGDGDE